MANITSDYITSKYPTLAGSNPAQDDGFSRAIKICITSIGGEVKLLAPCREIIWHVKDPCRV
jgi:hypothetical protein